MTTDELEQFQIALSEAFAERRVPTTTDPDLAAYVASFEPHLVELTIQLVARWSKRSG